MALPQTPPKFTTVITGSKEYSIEINDANFETQAWKLPRYEGCQLFTTKLNKVSSTTISGSGSVAGKHYVGPIIGGGTGSITVPDKTGYGKTACVQKYTRNIYVGNAVVGMDNGGENDKLLNFPEFSYVTTNVYYTINDDGTITTNRLESDQDDFTQRRGFYRAFSQDFAEGSNCKIIINDISIKTSLQDNYVIYFNGGQLERILNITTANLTNHQYLFDEGITTSNPTDGSPPSNFPFFYQPTLLTQSIGFNETSSQQFYPGFNQGGLWSLIEPHPTADAKISQFYKEDLNNEFLNVNPSVFFGFIGKALAFKTGSNYIGDKRFFLTFCKRATSTTDLAGTTGGSAGNPIPIYTRITGSVPNNLEGNQILSRNLAELSTGEIIEVDGAVAGNNGHMKISNRYQFNQVYAGHSGSSTSGNSNLSSDVQNHGPNTSGTPGPPTPSHFEYGQYVITKTEDTNPSLLLNLFKDKHLPNGVGAKGFVIIPENIHPHIKKNLTYFLAKAGVPLGIDVVPALDNEFKKLR